MINAAVIGLGRWGKNIVDAVQGKSKRLRFIRGVSKEPELVRDFAAAKGFELSTEFQDALPIRAFRRSFLQPRTLCMLDRFPLSRPPASRSGAKSPSR